MNVSGQFCTELISEIQEFAPDASHVFSYSDTSGELRYVKLRFPTSREGKSFAFYHKNGNEWNKGRGDCSALLYGSNRIAEARRNKQVILVVEGEKDAESCWTMGFSAVSGDGGAGTWHDDWSQQFQGCDIAICYDLDEAGRKGLDRVARALHGHAEVVRLIQDLPGMPEGGKDLTDWFAAGHRHEELAEIIRNAPSFYPGGVHEVMDGDEGVTSTTPLVFQPFPIDALPDPVAAFVTNAAEVMGVDPVSVAVPLLVTMAGAVGNTRVVRLKRGWREPAILRGVLIQESGQRKSPPLEVALQFTRHRQQVAFRCYEEMKYQFDQDMQEYQKDLVAWRKGKNGGIPPEVPKAPVCERFIVSDVTVQAVGALLAENPRGLLLARDELAGFFGDFDKFSNSRGGDAPFWLETYDARGVTIDRKTGDPKTLYIPRASVSIAGTIQPDIARRVFCAEHFKSGQIPRFLLAMPPRRMRIWSEAEIREDLTQAMQRIFEFLFDLSMHQPDADDPEQDVCPETVSLGAEAKAAFLAFFEEHGTLLNAATGDEAAALSKLEAICARLALILHCVWMATVRCEMDVPLAEDTMQRAVALTRWFRFETLRVYRILGADVEQEQQRTLYEQIESMGGNIELRTWYRSKNLSKEAAEKQLQALVDAGLAQWAWSSPPRHGGKQRKSLWLLPTDNRQPS